MDTLLNDKKRIVYIDIIRGGAVILVLLHHCGILKPYILGFHMPLFFFLSGLVFRCSESREIPLFFVYFKRRFVKLVIPYLGFEFINLFFALILHNVFNILHYEAVYHVELGYAIRDILLCISSDHYTGITSRLWFLPCMLFSDIIFYIFQVNITKFNKSEYCNCKSILYLFIFILLVFLSFAEHISISVPLPFILDTSIMGVAFIALGYAIKHLLDWCYTIQKHWNLLFVFIGGFGLYICVRLNPSVYVMATNSYGNYLYATVGAILGIISFSNLIFMSYRYIPKIHFEFLSYNSLVFYPLHLQILAGISKILEYVPLGNVGYFIVPVIKVILTMLIVVPCIFFINKYLLFLSGKSLEPLWEKRRSKIYR